MMEKITGGGILEYCFVYSSPIGPLTVTARDGNITGLYLRPPTEVESALPDNGPARMAVEDLLDRYFAGMMPDPGELSLDADGTPFQKLIWDLLLTIPYGQVRTYGQLAKEAAQILGKDKMSAQAVGGAVGSNPISLIIPCHRVIAAGRKLGGYLWGTEAKKWLLRHEGGNYDDQ